MTHSTVMIVGAGPVGMTLASELVRYGVQVRIVDKASQRTDKSKALVLWSRTLEMMDRGIGTKRFLDAGFKVNALIFIAGRSVIGHVDVGLVNTPYPFAMMLPQYDTERLLEERLAELNVTVERNVEVTAITNGPSGTTATLKNSNGQEEAVAADWLVGCDGAHSVVRHSVGATFDGETNDSDWILADVHMTGYPVPDTEASVYWHEDGAFVVFPISPGRYRVLADLPASGESKTPTPSLTDVQTIIDRRGPGNMKAYDPIWLAGFRINGRKVSRYRWGRVFLAGDAAHVHSPAGGQGMNTGMQDAFNLAWKLALVVNGTCGEALLDSYSAERSYVGDQVLKSAGTLTKLGTLRNPVAASIRNTVGHLMLGFSSVQHAFAENMTEVAIGYPKSPLNGPSTRGAMSQPGQRLPPAEGQKPLGSSDRPLFTLFAKSNAPVEALLEQYRLLLEPDVGLELGAGVMTLVRPDGYVACSATDTTTLSAYLESIT